ncbi:MAG: hypothetical protein L6R37_008071 [Teloschistes peruensis]|nr:MAG: hypothetical protein L6R37_008071 [Teloschistes peruensis]
MPGPPPYTWQGDPNAPLGSYLNPQPRVVYKRPMAADGASNQSQKHGRSRSEGSRMVPAQQAALVGAKVTSEFQETDLSFTSSSQSTSTNQSQDENQQNPRETRHVHFKDDKTSAKWDRKSTKAASLSQDKDLEDVFEYVEVHPANRGYSCRSSASAIPGEYRPSSTHASQTTTGLSARSRPVYMTEAMPDTPPRRPRSPHSRKTSVDSATELHSSSPTRYSSPPPSRDSQRFYYSYENDQQSSNPAPPSNNQRTSRPWTPPGIHDTRGHRYRDSDYDISPPRRTRPPSGTRDFDHGEWPLCSKCKKNKATVTDYYVEECRTCIQDMAREQEREAQEMARHKCVVCEDASAKSKDRELYFCGECWHVYKRERAGNGDMDVDMKRLRRKRSLLCMVCDEKLYTVMKKDAKFCDGCFRWTSDHSASALSPALRSSNTLAATTVVVPATLLSHPTTTATAIVVPATAARRSAEPGTPLFTAATTTTTATAVVIQTITTRRSAEPGTPLFHPAATTTATAVVVPPRTLTLTPAPTPLLHPSPLPSRSPTYLQLRVHPRSPSRPPTRGHAHPAPPSRPPTRGQVHPAPPSRPQTRGYAASRPRRPTRDHVRVLPGVREGSDG